MNNLERIQAADVELKRIQKEYVELIEDVMDEFRKLDVASSSGFTLFIEVKGIAEYLVDKNKSLSNDYTWRLRNVGS